ncbi:MAG: hypothetical protein IJ571_00520 [Ruminococcus sp.]|nr:hypothetical protein [Ruminococcus sp.]
MKKINRTYSFYEDTLRQINFLMDEYNTKNASELIRMLIDNEYNRLKNPHYHADAKENQLEQLAEIKRMISSYEEYFYECRDLLNSYAIFIDCDFSSSDTNLSNAKLSECLVKSRENYQALKHQRSVKKAIMNSNRPPEKR